MGRIKYFLLSMLCFSTTLSMGQTDDALSRINAIKMQGNTYLYSGGTGASWEQAMDAAKSALKIEIEIWVKQQGKTEVDYIAKAQNKILEIRSMRETLYYAFAYVKKVDIIPYNEVNQLIVVSQVNKTEMRDVTPQPDSTAKSAKGIIQPQLTQIEQEMLTIYNANNIGTYIKKLKQENKLSGLGKFEDIPQNGDCYLFVFNREYQVIAHLKKQGQIYTNIQTGKQEKMSNYNNCGAYWFQLK